MRDLGRRVQGDPRGPGGPPYKGKLNLNSYLGFNSSCSTRCKFRFARFGEKAMRDLGRRVQGDPRGPGGPQYKGKLNLNSYLGFDSSCSTRCKFRWARFGEKAMRDLGKRVQGDPRGPGGPPYKGKLNLTPIWASTSSCSTRCKFRCARWRCGIWGSGSRGTRAGRGARRTRATANSRSRFLLT